ncbi:MAG TPA: GreA/GreB family elongation factor [Verrucomicrobiae bacterium]|nr:GreA/GreB family elongation factor [Verrucomicrobiae bacterium]
MSKAFTRESDDASGDEIAPLRTDVPTGATRYITRDGADRLRQQANALLQEKRTLVSGGRAGGIDTTARVRRIEAAIQRLEQVLDSVIIAEPPADSGKVGFGASVRIRDQQGEEETYQIVGPDEAEPAQGRISSISPLAQALMNSKAGDTVRFKSPAGEQELTILTLRY